MKVRYDSETGLLGKAYSEDMQVPDPYIILTTEELNTIAQATDKVAFVINNELVMKDREEYEREEAARKEAERIKNLQCTKRVFVLMLQELGINYYEHIVPLLESNTQAKLEWELCVELLRKNPLLDTMAAQFGITSTQLDNLFKYANGEITLEQFRGEA